MGGESVAIFWYVYGTTANGCSGGEVWLSFRYVYGTTANGCSWWGGKVWLSSGMYTVRLLTAVLGGGSVAIFRYVYGTTANGCSGWGGESVAIFWYVYGTTANGCSGGEVWLSFRYVYGMTANGCSRLRCTSAAMESTTCLRRWSTWETSMTTCRRSTSAQQPPRLSSSQLLRVLELWRGCCAITPFFMIGKLTPQMLWTPEVCTNLLFIANQGGVSRRTASVTLSLSGG